MNMLEWLRRLTNTEGSELNPWWECSQCGALSMHYTWFNRFECVNCDKEDDNV